MSRLLRYVRNNWGVEPQCGHCRSTTPALICGSCFEHVYCNVSCQVKHNYQCIGGRLGDKKRGREEEKQEEETEVDWKSIPYDVWEYIFSFLNTNDLKNASSLSKDIARGVRRMFFRTFRFKITPQMANDPAFLKIQHEVKKVSMESDIMFMYFQNLVNVTDVRIWESYFGNVLPDSVLTLHLHIYNPEKLKRITNFPSKLVSLTISGPLGQSLDGILPRTLRYLELGETNAPLNDLPESLEELRVLFAVDMPVYILKLPSMLRSLWIRGRFDQSLDLLRNTPNLERLAIIGMFNQPLDHLPFSLTYLEMGDYFNQPIEGQLPPNLKTLMFANRFDQDIDGLLPAKLESLSLQDAAFNRSVDRLPASLLHLDLSAEGLFDQPVNHLPPRLIKLELGNSFNQDISAIPDSIIDLSLGDTFNQSLRKLPRGLKMLWIGEGYDQALPPLPHTLEELSIRGSPVVMANRRLLHPFDFRYLPNLKVVEMDERTPDEDVLVNPGVEKQYF